MTLRELLNSGVEIEGYRKIQCWEDENSPTIYHEGYDNKGLSEEYLDREVAYIFPYAINVEHCTIAALCIELAE